MTRRWHHGHSTAVGVLIGVLLSRHVWLMFAGGFAAGVVVAYLRQSAAWFADKVAHWRAFGPSRRAVLRDGPTPVYRTRGRGQSDTVPF